MSIDNNCIHPNCKFINPKPNMLCDYHKEELKNSGTEEHWKCSWCEEYKEKEFQDKDQEQRISADI